MSKDWDDIKAKAKEESKSLIDFEDTKPKTDTIQTTDIDEIPFSKLQIGQDIQKEEPLEVMESLVLLSPATETSEDMAKNTDREVLMEAEGRLQREEEKSEMSDQIYMGQVSDEEDSDMDTDESNYTYFR